MGSGHGRRCGDRYPWAMPWVEEPTLLPGALGVLGPWVRCWGCLAPGWDGGGARPLGMMVGAQPLGVMLEDARPLGAGTGVLLEHSPVGKSARRAGKKFADACFALLQSSDLLGLLKESRFGNDQKG